MSSKLHNLKAARQLATEITESGAKLFDFLGQEKELKESREKALEFLDSISRNLDTNTEGQGNISALLNRGLAARSDGHKVPVAGPIERGDFGGTQGAVINTQVIHQPFEFAGAGSGRGPAEEQIGFTVECLW